MRNLLSRLSKTLFVCAAVAVPVGGCGDDGVPKFDTPEHCEMVLAPKTAFAGGRVSSAPLRAGAAEGILHMPIGSALGAYTSRSNILGREGFIDERAYELSQPFSASVGFETRPRVKVLVLENGEDHVVFIKLDLGASYRGLTRDIEDALGKEYSGKVILAVSHTHSGFGHFTGAEVFYLGFSVFRREVYEAMARSAVSTMSRSAPSPRSARPRWASLTTASSTSPIA